MKLVAPPKFAMCDFSYTLHIVGFRVSDITYWRELKMKFGKEKWKGVAYPQLQNWDQITKYSKSKH
jgi:hypothetical protein